MLRRNQRAMLRETRVLSRWFQVRIEIRMFGRLIWSYVWPPDMSEPNVELDKFVEDD